MLPIPHAWLSFRQLNGPHADWGEIELRPDYGTHDYLVEEADKLEHLNATRAYVFKTIYGNVGKIDEGLKLLAAAGDIKLEHARELLSALAEKHVTVDDALRPFAFELTAMQRLIVSS